jgi:His-Xaa-Ser system protein HxsD
MSRECPLAPAVRIERQGPEAVLLINERIYSREAILRALHWYTDRLLVQVSAGDSTEFAVTLRPRKDGLDFEGILAELENALLDAQLRFEIARETTSIRELIVAKAFAEGDLLDDSPVGDWKDPVASLKKSNGSR